MKQKSHSGLKKRVKVRNSGTASVQKSCKNHLLSNKSKGQKKLHNAGMPLEKTRVKAIKKLLPGKIK
jgi:ribosomal protein L35